MSRRFLMAAAGALGLAGCAAVDPGPQVRLGAEPTVAGGLFSSGGGLVVAAELRDVDGRAAFCGAWARSRQSVLTEGRNRDVIETATAFVRGQRIVHGMAFLPEVELAAGYAGSRANCVLTRLAWDDGLAAEPLNIRIPRQIVVNDSDGEIASGGGGIIVTFRQTEAYPRGL